MFFLVLLALVVAGILALSHEAKNRDAASNSPLKAGNSMVTPQAVKGSVRKSLLPAISHTPFTIEDPVHHEVRRSLHPWLVGISLLTLAGCEYSPTSPDLPTRHEKPRGELYPSSWTPA